MRLSDLFEAPISDYSYSSYTDDKNSSFTPPERKILPTEKSKQRFIKAFKNTPFDFRVMFWNTDLFYATSVLDNADTQMHVDIQKAGIHDNYNDVEGEEGKITVVILGNLSPVDRIPMTPWILAHKIGHSFQDQSGKTPEIKQHVENINDILVGAALKIPSSKARIGDWKNFNYPASIYKLLSMRSMKQAPAGSNDFEIFPELVAQYLISGSVKLNQVGKISFEETEQELNEAIYDMLKSVEGKVIVEL